MIESIPNLKVTIGIPTFNRAGGMLQQALECALKQKYANLEILVSDNCSTDATYAVVSSYNDSRIKYHRQSRNIGPNANFNFCVENASGDYFLLFHDDDRIDSDFIQCCMNKINRNNMPALVRTGTRLIDAKGVILSEVYNRRSDSTYNGLLRDWSSGRVAFYLCSTLFRTELLRSLGGFNTPHNLQQDIRAWFKISKLGSSIDIPEIKASFRHHDGDLTGAATIVDWCDDSKYIIEELRADSDVEPQILDEITRFFTSLAYKRADSNSSILKRLEHYKVIENLLGDGEYPVAVLVKRYWRKLERRTVAFRARSK